MVFSYRKTSILQVINSVLSSRILVKPESYLVTKFWLLTSTAMVRVSAIVFLESPVDSYLP